MARSPLQTLVLDIGGTNVKVWRTAAREKTKIPSGSDFTPADLMRGVNELIGDWRYDRVSIGYPGEVRFGRPMTEPPNLGVGWVDCDFSSLFSCPLRIMNDACMQALGSYDGGRMLYLGLGTSIGTVFIYDGTIVPLSLGHLITSGRTPLEQRVNQDALEKHGATQWATDVSEAAQALQGAFHADYVVLGGGNVKQLANIPEGCKRGGNRFAFYGGLRMWDDIRQQDQQSYHRAGREVEQETATGAEPA